MQAKRPWEAAGLRADLYGGRRAGLARPSETEGAGHRAVGLVGVSPLLRRREPWRAHRPERERGGGRGMLTYGGQASIVLFGGHVGGTQRENAEYGEPPAPGNRRPRPSDVASPPHRRAFASPSQFDLRNSSTRTVTPSTKCWELLASRGALRPWTNRTEQHQSRGHMQSNHERA